MSEKINSDNYIFSIGFICHKVPSSLLYVSPVNRLFEVLY